MLVTMASMPNGEQLSGAEWKGHPDAGMHHGPCSISTDLSTDLGKIETVMGAPGSAGQP